MKKRLLFFTVAAFAGVVLIALLGVYLTFSILASSDSSGLTAPVPWKAQPEKATAQNSEGIFSIRAAVASPQKMVFFYAVKAQQGNLVSASFLPDENLRNSLATYNIPVVSTIQELGKLGDYNVGFIQSGWTPQPNQAFNLQVKDSAGNTWVTTPLVETAEPYSFEGSDYITIENYNAVPIDVMWDVISATSLGKISVKGPGSSATLLISLNSSMNISTLDKTEYDALYAKAIKPK